MSALSGGKADVTVAGLEVRNDPIRTLAAFRQTVLKSQQATVLARNEIGCQIRRPYGSKRGRLKGDYPAKAALIGSVTPPGAGAPGVGDRRAAIAHADRFLMAML
jgi:hypothetical protein